jgi:hypothetical protein
MSNPELRLYGPLAGLIGVWEGEKGDDVAPSDSRDIENNRFRERMRFVPIGAVENHEQRLHGLRYDTTAWRLGEESPFHEEVGYWLWDERDSQVMRCFLIPRGVSVIAGGTVEPDATRFHLAAEAGSGTYGICSNRFLDVEFKTVRFELRVTLEDGVLSYDEDSQILMKGRTELFHHRDRNSLRPVSGA